MTTPPEPDRLLTTRAAVVLLTALVLGLVAGALSFLATQNVAAAVLVGGGAVVAVVPVINAILDRP